MDASDTPVKFIRAEGDTIIVDMFDPSGSGKRIQKAFPADELETLDERSERLAPEPDSTPLPKKPLYPV